MLKKIFVSIFVCLLITACAGKSDTISIDAGMDEEVQQGETSPDEEDEKGSDGQQTLNSEEEIYVYVCGWVKRSGVYKLPQGTRVCDAVDAAGGFKGKASRDGVNLAEALSDGQQIYIPSVDEVSSDPEAGSAGTGMSSGTESGKVNINTAPREELMTLTGIGEAKADAIISYREQTGAFSSIEDIMNISGIKEGVFSRIKDDITV